LTIDDFNCPLCLTRLQAAIRYDQNWQESLEVIYMPLDKEELELYLENEGFNLPIQYKMLYKKFQYAEEFLKQGSLQLQKLTFQMLKRRFQQSPY